MSVSADAPPESWRNIERIASEKYLYLLSPFRAPTTRSKVGNSADLEGHGCRYSQILRVALT